MAKKETKEKRIDDLVIAAVTEFLDKGYDGASMEGIARRAGVSKGGLYHHFSNKEVLLMEANRKLSEPVVYMCEEAYSCDSAINGLSKYIKNYLKYWGGHPKELSFLFLSMAKAMESGVLNEYYKEYVNDATQFFNGMFQKAVDLGELDLLDVEAYGISLMGALDGILSYLIINPTEDIDHLAERIEKIWVKK